MSSHVTRGSRSQRTSPYLIDTLAVTFHRSAAGMAWRWRTELTTLTLITAALLRLRHCPPPLRTSTWSGVSVTEGVVVV